METYLTYLQSHLGLDHIILPKVTPIFQFHCVADGELSPEEQELFLKIMSALKLSPNSYVQTVGNSEQQNLQAPHIVYFGGSEDPRGQWQDFSTDHRSLQTHSLASMLVEPQNKKECWQHLSKVLALIH